MYLKRCWIENIGAITKFNLPMPFNVDGTPKPVVLVGANGTGKTILQSYIADALIEFSKQGFNDAVKGQGHLSPFFRLVGRRNQKEGTTYGFAIIEFDLNFKTTTDSTVNFSELYGETAPENFSTECQNLFNKQLAWQSRSKSISNIEAKQVQKELNGRSHCFFPYNRFEQPHWINDDAISQKKPFDLDVGFTDRLGERNIIVAESYSKNQSWLLHLFLDSRADFVINPYTYNNSASFTLKGTKESLVRSSKSLENVNKILKIILKNQNANLFLMSRTLGLSIIGVEHNNTILIPSLQHISAGQAILFNMFLSIIRHADTQDTNKSIELEHIEDIVLIDEIDAHIHSDLQYEVLPRLLKLFPRIQFILTSHAPIFVLGMECVFGKSGYNLLEMPDGNIISSERFSEFQQSFKYYQDTKFFDDTQRAFLKEELAKSTKPLVLTEGSTDQDYIKTAMELLGYTELANNIDVEWVGSTRNGQEFFTGDKSLNNAAEFLRANPKLIQNRRTLLLYDFDSNKTPSVEGNLWISSVEKNTQNQKIKKLKRA